MTALKLLPDETYIDATFGRGGHSREILSLLGEKGRLLALDRDPEAIAAASAIADPRFAIQKAPFSQLSSVAKERGISSVAGILLDVGVSSPQLDDAARGFSFREDAPLDMRMDTTSGETAADFVARASLNDLTEVIKHYGEERFALQIAKKIVAARTIAPITRTSELAALVRQTVRTYEPGKDPATRTFQALRIFLNQELSELARVLPQALSLLKEGGRLVVISFHSLEDRIVKRLLQKEALADHAPKNLPLKAADLPKPALKIIGKPIRASAAELVLNPRAKSAIMRVAERLSGQIVSSEKDLVPGVSL